MNTTLKIALLALSLTMPMASVADAQSISRACGRNAILAIGCFVIQNEGYSYGRGVVIDTWNNRDRNSQPYPNWSQSGQWSENPWGSANTTPQWWVQENPWALPEGFGQ